MGFSRQEYWSGLPFPSPWMGELDHKESWAPKNWCFWSVVLQKTLENPLDCKIKPVNPKRNQPWIFIGRTDAEATILWPPDVKSWLTEKDPDAGKDWRLEERGNRGLPTQWTWTSTNSGDSEGQKSLACCSAWGHKKSDMTWQLNNIRGDRI